MSWDFVTKAVRWHSVYEVGGCKDCFSPIVSRTSLRFEELKQNTRSNADLGAKNKNEKGNLEREGGSATMKREKLSISKSCDVSCE